MMNKLSSSRKGAVMFRSYPKNAAGRGATRQRHSELGFNMSLCVFDKGWGRLSILLSAGILHSTWAASQELPDAPSAVMGTSVYAAGDLATSADARQSSAAASADSSPGGFLTRWVKRGFRDQADIYTTALHRSEMKWVVGLPVVTAGLIAIDKHASGALPRNPSSASADISDLGLFATAAAAGGLPIDGPIR